MSNKAESIAKRAERGEFPAAAEERFLGRWDGLWFMSCFAVATWNYLLGGWIASYLGFWPAFGALCLTVPAMYFCSICVIPQARYGLDQFVGMRAWLGTHLGIPSLPLLILATLTWVTLAMTMAARSFNEILAAGEIPTIDVRAVGVIFTLICGAICWRGAVAMKWFARIAIPIIIAVTISIICLFAFKIGWSPVLEAEPAFATGTGFDLAVGIGLGLSWICCYPIFGQVFRSFKTESSAVVSGTIGFGVLTVFTGFVGIISALYVGDPDPTKWMIPIGGLTWGIISLAFIIFANFTSGATTAYCWAESIKAQFRKINWSLGLGLGLLLVIVMVVFPWVYDAFGSFVAVFYLLCCPIMSIALVEFFVLKKQKIRIKECYGRGAYYYSKGFNPAAWAVWIGGFIFAMYIYNPVNYETTLSIAGTPIFWYATDIIPTLVVSGIAYYLLGQFILKRKYPKAYE